LFTNSDAAVSLRAGRRPRAELFLDLPSRKEYPHYYKMIKQPVSLNQIRQRVESRASYKTMDDFRCAGHLSIPQVSLVH